MPFYLFMDDDDMEMFIIRPKPMDNPSAPNGASTVGSILTISSPDFLYVDATTQYTYQWKLLGVPIGGATNPSLNLVIGLLGLVTCTVTANSIAGSASYTTPGVTVTL